MKSNSKKEAYQNFNGVSEKTKIEVIIDDIKSSTFSVLFVLLKEEEEHESRLQKMFETGLEYLQTMNFMFSHQIQSIWNSSAVFSSLFSFFTFFNVTNQFGTIVTLPVYLFQFYFLVFVILFIMVDIIYVSISFKRKKFNSIWPLIILRNFVNLAVTVLFLVIVEILMEMVL